MSPSTRKRPTDPRFQRPYPSRRQRPAARRAAGPSLRKLFLQLTAVVALLLVATLVLIFQTDGGAAALTSNLPVPVGQ